MKKRLLNIIGAIILTLILSVSVFGCSGGEDDPEQNVDLTGLLPDVTDRPASFPVADAVINVDAEGTDAGYDFMRTYTMGVRRNVDIKFANVSTGLYIFMTVKDSTNMYHKSSLEESDYIEVSFDAGLAAPAVPNRSIFRLKVDVLGRYEYMQGTGNVSEPFEVKGSRIISETDITAGAIVNPTYVTSGTQVQQFAFNRIGTPTRTTAPLSADRQELEASDSYKDVDTGYSVEAYFSWNELDSDRVEEMGIAFAHNDIQNVTTSLSGYHNNISVETPNKYHRLRFLGEGQGVAKPTTVAEVKIDGKMDETVWASAKNLAFKNQDVTLTTTPAGGDPYPINGRAFFGNRGMYIGINVADRTLNAPSMDNKAAQTIYNNDHVELRMHLFNNEGGDALRSFSVLFDVAGNIWYNSPVSTMSTFDSEFKMTAYGTIGDDSDEDEGFCLELFIPYYELKVEANTKAYAMILYGIKNITVADGLVTDCGIQLNYPGADYLDDANWHKVDKFMKVKQ
jgi:hypothetical protein